MAWLRGAATSRESLVCGTRVRRSGNAHRTGAGDSIVWSNIAKGTKPIHEQVLGKLLTDECRRLFPEKEIPYPTTVKSHPWESGATYWTPGLYDPVKASQQSLKPFDALPNLYICGESFSMKQAWIEGALENSRALLRILE